MIGWLDSPRLLGLTAGGFAAVALGFAYIGALASYLWKGHSK